MKTLKAYSPNTPRKTPQANDTDETHLQQNKEDHNLILRGKGGGVWQLKLSQIIYFQSLAGDNIYFIQLQNRPFILRYSLFDLMDAGLFFYWTQASIFILLCLTAKIFIFKKTASHPPPRINCSSPNKKGISFNHSLIAPTAKLNT